MSDEIKIGEGTDPTKTWLPLEGNWDDIPDQVKDLDCVLVVNPTNWHYHIHIKGSGKRPYEHPKKRNIRGIDSGRTDFLDIDEVLGRIEEWQEKKFSPIIESDYLPYFLNTMFTYIHAHKMDTKKGIKWLWCGTDNKSYTDKLIDELIIYPNEIEAMIEVGKENTENELKKQEEEKKGSIIIDTSKPDKKPSK